MSARGSGKGDETLHPFWAVERLSEDELRRNKKGCVFNLILEDKEFPVVTVGTSHGSSIAVTLAVVIPIMTNTIDVKKGEELLMPIAAKTTAKRKAASWKDEVADPAKETQTTESQSETEESDGSRCRNMIALGQVAVSSRSRGEVASAVAGWTTFL